MSTSSADGAFRVPVGDEPGDHTLEIEELRRRIYGRSGADDSGLAEAELRLATLLETAVRKPSHEAEESESIGDEPDVDRADEAPEDALNGRRAEAPDEPVHPDAPPYRTAFVLGLIALLLVIGAGVRFALPPTADALAVFDVPADAQDLAPAPSIILMDDTTEAAVSRYLGNSFGWDLWGLRGTKGSICIYAQQDNLSREECVSSADFARSGVGVELVSPIIDTATEEPVATATWGPGRGPVRWDPIDKG